MEDHRFKLHATNFKEKCPWDETHHCTNKDMETHGSVEKPIKVDEKHLDKYVAWEYRHISHKLTVPRFCLQQLYGHEDGRRIDRLVARTPTGEHHAYYFDITEQMDAQDEIYEKAWKDAGEDVNKLPKEIQHVFKTAVRLKEEAQKRKRKVE